MARWAPGALERLQRAALELFAERGYEATTVAEISAQAGVTERTFFRYFSDKREVLFAGQGHFEAAFTDALAGAPADTPLMALVTAALDAGAAALQGARSRDQVQARHAIINANEQLRERELLKMAKLARAVTAAVRARGIPDLQARLIGDLVVSVFNDAFIRWVAPGETRDLAQLQRESLGAIADLVASN